MSYGIYHSVHTPNRNEEDCGINKHKQPLRNNSVFYKSDIESIFFKEEPVMFAKNAAELCPKGNGYKKNCTKNERGQRTVQM